jgi:hypothetical protein
MKTNPVVPCSSCAFLARGSVSSICRRKAPLPGDGDQARWPLVDAAADGCGEGLVVAAEPEPAPPAKSAAPASVAPSTEPKPAAGRKKKP